MTTLRAAVFTIAADTPDAMGPFAGYTDGTTWQGHAVPLFTHEQASVVASAFAAEREFDAWYCHASDAFVIVTPDNGEDEPLVFAGEDHTLNGVAVTLYPIGHYYEDVVFTWSERA